MNRNMKPVPNLFTYRILAIRLAVKEMKSVNFYAILLVSVMLFGIFSLSPAISTLMNDVIIRSTGRISVRVTANSGSAKDIQAAVDVIEAAGEGVVYIPEGTFNFVEVGDPWMTVDVPSGVSLFGAPTERDADGQVVAWKTVLVMPYDVPGSWGVGNYPIWFNIIGNGDPNKPSRFSDIKLVGYRSIDPNSTTIHLGIQIKNVVDFRVDHCYFEHICGGVLAASGMNCRGVIDHCFFVNHYGHVESGWLNCTVGYGVQMGREDGDVWEDDITKVLGQYTNYTVFIEDCYFEKWRHCIAANRGAHYILRYSTIKDDFGFGSIDAHGWGSWDGTKITQVGTRAVEIYNCTITDAIQSPWATFIRGGAGVAFNNTVGGGTYSAFIYLGNEADPEVSKCWCHDWWIWDNTLLTGCTEIIKYDPDNQIIEGVDYFLHPPHTFDYEPYPYPHPLTLEATP